MRKFIVLSIVLLMIAGFAITSSAEDSVDLVVGRKHIQVGELTVQVVNGDLVVTYIMYPVDLGEEGWELLETHLYVGVEPPEKSAPGQFPYGPESDYVTDDGFTIPLSVLLPLLELPLDKNFFIAAQAEIGKIDDEGGAIYYPDTVVQIEETTWAYGEDQIPPGKNWAMYFEFDFTICWSLVGDWEITAYVGDWGSGPSYIHGMTITDDSFSGLDYYPPESTDATGEITGTVTGNHVVWTNETLGGSSYVADIDGTIADNGTMSGTWFDSNNLLGDWKSTDGEATLIYCN